MLAADAGDVGVNSRQIRKRNHQRRMIIRRHAKYICRKNTFFEKLAVKFPITALRDGGIKIEEEFIYT